LTLDELCATLDTYFNVHAFDESDGWEIFWDDIYRETFRRFARSKFVDGSWNGLMLDNRNESGTVERVYLVVFPTQSILDTIIAQEVERDAPGALIFAHHVSAFSESKAAFEVIQSEQLEELREHNISYYNCHAPLDCHAKISTANALANAFDLQDQERFAPYYGGYAGIHGTISPMSFQKFAERLQTVCELDSLRYDQIRNNGQLVEHVAILPGGGDDAETMHQAAKTGADTYVTGHWWLFGDSDFAVERRTNAASLIPPIGMNLVAASHYATEMVVMRDQMVDWLTEQGIDSVVMRQQNPWR
jgi:putative NIF3 family GTP cyclohydrolase 1 type 2